MINRLRSLALKLISIKGLILVLATWLVYTGKISDTTWALAASVIVGARAWEKKNGP